jgi:hypothetical protein
MATKISKENDLIFNDIESICGTSESSKVYMVTTVKTGETELVIELN